MEEAQSISLKKGVVLSGLVFLLCGAVVAVIFATEPQAKRGGATKKTAMLVEVVKAERGTFEPLLVVTGTVRAERDVLLTPQVEGALIRRSEAFTPGSMVKSGTELVQIDPANYQIALSQQKSALSQAQTTLSLELGQQVTAKQEYEALFARGPNAETLSDEEMALVLRQPQLAAAKEGVSAARAAVKQAELDLRRTTLRAPFDAQVITREVDVGAHVQPGMTLGRLVGFSKYWVEAAVPLGQRRWLHFPTEDDASCSPVQIVNRASWPEGAYREGCLSRFIGALDDATRLARLLIDVADPLARTPEVAKTGPPLVLGEFVEARISGVPLTDVVRVPREFVRKGGTVWLAQDEKLVIQEIDPVLVDAHYAYVKNGIDEGDRIVTTHLSRVYAGAPLRFARDAAQEQTAQEQTAQEPVEPKPHPGPPHE